MLQPFPPTGKTLGFSATPLPMPVNPDNLIGVSSVARLANETTMGPANPLGSQKQNASADSDILREGGFRYWGYVNEMFESVQDVFRLFVDKAKAASWVRWSYGFVDKYVYIDAFDKGVKGYQKAKGRGESTSSQAFQGLTQAGDAFLFQTGASLYIPAMVVSVARDVSKFAMLALTGNRGGVADLQAELRDTILKNHDWYEKLLAQVKEFSIEKLQQTTLFKKALDVMPDRTLTRMGHFATKGIPMLLSLALIPIILHPIDKLVNTALDISYRPIVRLLHQALFKPNQQNVPATTALPPSLFTLPSAIHPQPTQHHRDHFDLQAHFSRNRATTFG